MENRLNELDVFFDHYAEAFNKSISGKITDVENTAALFSTCFIAANPLGVNCGQNNEAFLEAIKSGYTFYKNIGITSMDIIAKEITLLDDYHAMVRIRWQSNFIRKDGQQGNLRFENIYFIQTLESRHKVFAYITGDEQAALKDAGIL